MIRRLVLALILCLHANLVLAQATPTPTATPTTVYLCTSVTINPASTQVFPVPQTALHYLFVQNVSETCNIYCALGSRNTAAYQHGTKLTPSASWVPLPVTSGVIPSSADLACIGSNAGTGCTGEAYACEW
jgi:hypothetical protein